MYGFPREPGTAYAQRDLLGRCLSRSVLGNDQAEDRMQVREKQGSKVARSAKGSEQPIEPNFEPATGDFAHRHIGSRQPQTHILFLLLE